MSRGGWIRSLVVGLATFGVALSSPAVGVAAGEPTELLSLGAGYAAPEGSPAVRDVQRLLDRLGMDPGPIDGLYGPLTAAGVQRFQAARDLTVDGVVGPLTMGRLAAERRRLRKAGLERKSPARSNRAESVPEPAAAQPPQPAPPQPAPPRERPNAPAEPESSGGPPPELAAVIGGLALMLLLVVLSRLVRRRRRPSRVRPATGPSPGLVLAGLIAAFAVGAATGALFASEATPDGEPERNAAVAQPRGP